MSVLELAPHYPQELIRGGIEQLKYAIGRISSRDVTQAQAALLQSCDGEGILRDALLPEILPATKNAGPRLLQVATIRQRGLDQEIRLTTPVSMSDKSGENILLRPGLSMKPNSSATTVRLHDTMADMHPGAVVLTHGNPGVGEFATRLPLRKAIRLRNETVAADQLDVAENVFGSGARVDSIHHSYSAAPGMLAAYQSLGGEGIEYKSVTTLVGALLPKGCSKAAVYKFAAHKIRTAARELDGGYPEVLVEGVRFLADVPYACYGNAIELWHGEEAEIMEAVVQRIPTLIVSSESCPLKLKDFYDHLEAKSGGNVLQYELEGCGHDVEGRIEETVDIISNFMKMGFLAASRVRRESMHNVFQT